MFILYIYSYILQYYILIILRYFINKKFNNKIELQLIKFGRKDEILEQPYMS